MQPYFFPYLGYFSLIKSVDCFVLFDTVQFIRHGWIERNRILKPNEGWQYINIPTVKHSRETNIMDVKINNSIDWKKKIFAQLEHYKKWAPNYQKVIDLLHQVFLKDYDTIVDLNYNSLQSVCSYLDITTDISIFSAMNMNIDPVHSPDEWALNICKKIPGVEEYWNPPGGMSFFDRDKYTANGIKLYFHEIQLESYNQKRSEFEPGLSILDVMMFNSPQEINDMLDKYVLQ